MGTHARSLSIGLFRPESSRSSFPQLLTPRSYKAQKKEEARNEQSPKALQEASTIQITRLTSFCCQTSPSPFLPSFPTSLRHRHLLCPTFLPCSSLVGNCELPHLWSVRDTSSFFQMEATRHRGEKNAS